MRSSDFWDDGVGFEEWKKVKKKRKINNPNEVGECYDRRQTSESHNEKRLRTFSFSSVSSDETYGHTKDDKGTVTEFGFTKMSDGGSEGVGTSSGQLRTYKFTDSDGNPKKWQKLMKPSEFCKVMVSRIG